MTCWYPGCDRRATRVAWVFNIGHVSCHLHWRGAHKTVAMPPRRKR